MVKPKLKDPAYRTMDFWMTVLKLFTAIIDLISKVVNYDCFIRELCISI